MKPQIIEFSLDDLAKTLIKASNLTSGRWALSVELHFTAAVMRPPPDRIPLPTGAVSVSKVALSDASSAPDDAPLVFDAAVVNPAPTKKSSAAKPAAAKKRAAKSSR